MSFYEASLAQSALMLFLQRKSQNKCTASVNITCKIHSSPFAFADRSELVFCRRAEQRSRVCQQGLIVGDASYQVAPYILKNTLNDVVKT